MISGLAIVLVFVIGTVGVVGALLISDHLKRKKEDARVEALNVETPVTGGAAISHPTSSYRVIKYASTPSRVSQVSRLDPDPSNHSRQDDSSAYMSGYAAASLGYSSSDSSSYSSDCGGSGDSGGSDGGGCGGGD